MVGLNIEAGNFNPDKNIHHTHEGSIGNLCNSEIKELMYSTYNSMDFAKAKRAEDALLKR
jgi:argininosuccinate lyase